MNGSFAGRTVFVGGGTGALGRALSLAFLQEGAMVAVTFRRQEEFDSLRRAAADRSTQLEGHRIDVTDDSAVTQLVNGLLATHGKVDAMVSAVGGYEAGTTLSYRPRRILSAPRP